jgi:N-acetylglucosamine-6-phosphate deacetylase
MIGWQIMRLLKTLIHNGHLISPGQEIREAWLLLEDGRIAGRGGAEDAPPAAERKIDAGGRWVLPGFIDIHSHGAGGRDVCDADPEAFRHIARRKLAEGVTTWLPTTLTETPERLEAVALAFAEYFSRQEIVRTPGLHLEGPFINRDRAGAQNPQHVRPPDVAEFRKLAEIAPVLLLSLAPEMPGALELIGAARAAGVTVSAAHTCASCAEVRAACEAGLTHLTHFGNAMTPLHHREIGVVGAGFLDERLMLELIADRIHLSDDMLRLIFRMVPLDRLMMITDSVAASWSPDGELDLAGLSVVVKDGVARLKEGGALAGSTLKANEGLRNLACVTGLPLADLVAVTSWNQARSLGLRDVGKLEPGYAADVVLLEADFAVWKTVVGGEERFEA